MLIEPLAGSGLLLYLCAQIVECHGIEHHKLQPPWVMGEDQRQRQAAGTLHHQEGVVDVLRAEERQHP